MVTGIDSPFQRVAPRQFHEYDATAFLLMHRIKNNSQSLAPLSQLFTHLTQSVLQRLKYRKASSESPQRLITSYPAILHCLIAVFTINFFLMLPDHIACQTMKVPLTHGPSYFPIPNLVEKDREEGRAHHGTRATAFLCEHHILNLIRILPSCPTYIMEYTVYIGRLIPCSHTNP